MKKIALAIAALLISVSAMAGNNSRLPFVSFGIKAGYISNQQKINNPAELLDVKGNANGFNAGIVARVDFPMLPLFVQGELLYDWGRYKNIDNFVQGSITTNNLSVPVLIGAGIGSSNFVKLRVNLGPVFNLVSSAKFSDVMDGAASLEDMFRRQTVTWTAGIGVDLFNIMLDVRYNGVFSKKKISELDMSTTSVSPTSWTVSIGYLF